MIGYYTDNNISHSVMKAVGRSGIKVRHIKNFDKDQPAVFYGILRGCGAGMLHHKIQGIPFFYIDNGYFDAMYMDLTKHKEMSGKYRVVKNGMIEPFMGAPRKEPIRKCKVLGMPPSPYTAFMYDTSPEDWNLQARERLIRLGHEPMLRDKTDQQPLLKCLKHVDAVYAFNSMGAVAAIDAGKAVYTTQGVVQNDHLLEECLPYYDIAEIRKFYEPKQFTLGEISEGKACLS